MGMRYRVRRFLDGLFMTDVAWKEKYCPNIMRWFAMSDKERREAFDRMKARADDNYRDMLRGAGHSEEVIDRHMTRVT